MIICLQSVKFLRRWNWKKCWNQTVRSHLSVANAAAKVIQKNWRYTHLLYSVHFLELSASYSLSQTTAMVEASRRIDKRGLGRGCNEKG